MISTIVSILLSSLIFLWIVLMIAMNQINKFKLIPYLFFIASIIGLMIYGIGFYMTFQEIPLAVLRTVLATLGMFLGKNEYSAISEAFKNLLNSNETAFLLFQIIFWVIHALALFLTANAVLASIGANILIRIKTYLSTKKKKVIMIYGVNQETLDFATDYDSSNEEKKNLSFIFIDNNPDSGLKNIIQKNGWIVLEEKMLPSLGIKKNMKIHLYVLSENYDGNKLFLESFINVVESIGIDCKNLAVTLLADMGTTNGMDYQKYFASVMVVDNPYLVAKSLVTNFPPSDVINFNEKCEAINDFHMVLIGYGKIGQSILEHVYANGHFLNNRFKATIVDPQYKMINGYIKTLCPCMKKNFLQEEDQTEGMPIDARQHEFYKYLSENKKTINYFVICTGNDKKDKEIANEILTILTLNNINVPIFTCSYNKITKMNGQLKQINVFTRKNLDISLADKDASMINQAWYDITKLEDKETREKNWADCNYFNRLSSQAAIGFASSMDKASGGALSDTAKELDEDMLYNLARLEHIRWSAFHFAFGYKPMSRKKLEEYAQNIDNYHLAKGFHKDQVLHEHACLVPWEELKELSDYQTAALGNSKLYGDKNINVDYIEADIKNIITIKTVYQKIKE